MQRSLSIAIVSNSPSERPRRMRPAVAAYDRAGSIAWTRTQDEARGALVEAWKRDTAAEPAAKRFVFAYTNRDVDTLNGELRQVRYQRGELPGPEIAFDTKRERRGRGERNMIEDRFFKRLSKKARKGLRGWPIATIAFYGPNLSQATKAAVGIVPSENAGVEELRDWKVERGDIRANPGVAREILEFIEQHQVRSVAITDGIIGCPHEKGIDYEGEWCPVCEFWHGRDRFTGERVH